MIRLFDAGGPQYDAVADISVDDPLVARPPVRLSRGPDDYGPLWLRAGRYLMECLESTLLNRCSHGDDGCAGSCRTFTGRLNGESIAAFISGLRRIFVGRYVELFQRPVCGFL